MLLVRLLFMRSSCSFVRVGVMGVYMITSPPPSGCPTGGVPGYPRADSFVTPLPPFQVLLEAGSCTAYPSDCAPAITLSCTRESCVAVTKSL